MYNSVQKYKLCTIVISKYTPLDLSLYNSNARLWKEGTLGVRLHRYFGDSGSDVKTGRKPILSDCVKFAVNNFSCQFILCQLVPILHLYNGDLHFSYNITYYVATLLRRIHT